MEYQQIKIPCFEPSIVQQVLNNYKEDVALVLEDDYNLKGLTLLITTNPSTKTYSVVVITKTKVCVISSGVFK